MTESYHRALDKQSVYMRYMELYIFSLHFGIQKKLSVVGVW